MRSSRPRRDRNLIASDKSPLVLRIAVAAEGRQELAERKANLDRRVSNGEITSLTRSRYLAAHKRQLRERLGYDRLVRWPERLLVWAILPILDAHANRRSD